MPKYHEFSSFDAGTGAPNSNFIYDFEVIRYFIRDNWQQVLEQDKRGNTISGSADSLSRAFLDGCEVKVGVKGLFNGLADTPGKKMEHEVFIQTGWCYYYSEQKLFIAATHPLVRVRPNIPLQYSSGEWDFGWLLIRSDGYGKLRICNHYTLKFIDTEGTYPVRWFVR